MQGRPFAIVTMILMGSLPMAAQEAPLNEPDPEVPGVGVPFEPDADASGAAVTGDAAPIPEADAGSALPADEAEAAPDGALSTPPDPAESDTPDAAGAAVPEDGEPDGAVAPEGTDDPAAPDAGEADDPDDTAPAPDDPAPGDAGPSSDEDGPAADTAEAPETETPPADAAEEAPVQTAPPAEITEDAPAPERPRSDDPATDRLLGYVADALIELQDLREELDNLRADLDGLTGQVGRHALLLRQICTDAGYEAAKPVCDAQPPDAEKADALGALEGNVAALETQVEDLLRRLDAQEEAAQAAREAPSAPQLAEIQPASPAEPFFIRRDAQGRPIFPARRELQDRVDALPDAASCADGGAWLEANVPDRIDNAFFVTEDGGLRRCTLVNGAWEVVFTGRLDKAHVVIEGAAR